MNEKVMQSLRSVELFSDLEDPELLEIAGLCKVLRVPVDYVLFHEGEDGDTLFIIQEGKVRVSLTTRTTDGKSAHSTINYLYSGQSFGELVLLDGTSRSATITAAGQSVLLVLKKQDFAALCQNSPRIGYRVMQRLASDLAYKLRSSNLLLRGNIRWQNDELGRG